MKRILVVILTFCAFLQNNTSGQEVALTVNYQSLAAVGDQIKLTYTVNSKDGTFKAPSFDDFYLIMGPATSFSQNFSNINGRMQSQISNSYTYYLQATTTGTFTLKPATYTIKGKTWYSDTVVIKVVESQTEKENLKGGDQPQSQGSGENIYIRLIPSARSVYVGQALPMALKLYTRQSIEGLGEEVLPGFKGFLKEDVEMPPLQKLDEENIGGVTYGTGIYKRFVLYPQSAGEFSIDPFRLTVLVRQQRGSMADQFFSDPFSSGFWPGISQVPLVLASLPVSISVKPLPLPSPADFEGAIGTLKLESSLSSRTSKVNEAITFTVRLKGEANFRLAGAPKISFPAGLESYDPKVIFKPVAGTYSPEGEKVFEYLLIPRNNGRFVIPAITYSYFDPTKSKYVTLTVPEDVVEVSGTASDTTGGILYSAPLKNDVRYLSSDIRYIKENQITRPLSLSLLIDSVLFLLLYPIMVVAALIMFFLIQKRRKQKGDVRLQKRRKAYRKATGKLRKVGKMVNSADRKVIYDELLIIVWGYLSERLGIPLSRLNRDKATEELSLRHVSPDLVNELISVIEIIEFSRYAAAGSVDDPQEMIKKTAALISSIEETI